MGDPADGWRDHDRFALTCENWPGSAHLARVAYRAPVRRRIGCVVNGPEQPARDGLAARLAHELGVPVLRREWLGDAVLFRTLAESPCGAVLSGWFTESDEAWVLAGLTGAGYDPARVPEVRCALGEPRAEGGRTAYGLGVGPSWEVRGEPDDRDLAALAVRIAAGQR